MPPYSVQLMRRFFLFYAEYGQDGVAETFNSGTIKLRGVYSSEPMEKE